MTQTYNAAVMTVFAELGELVLIDELIEVKNKYQELYEMVNPLMEEVFRVHTNELTPEVIKKTTKVGLIFDIQENGFGEELNGVSWTFKKPQLISIIHEKNITRHYNDYYKDNNLEELHLRFRVTNIRMKKITDFLENPRENIKDIIQFLVKEHQQLDKKIVPEFAFLKTMEEDIKKFETLLR